MNLKLIVGMLLIIGACSSESHHEDPGDAAGDACDCGCEPNDLECAMACASASDSGPCH